MEYRDCILNRCPDSRCDEDGSCFCEIYGQTVNDEFQCEVDVEDEY